jgi:hypothetical protein
LSAAAAPARSRLRFLLAVLVSVGAGGWFVSGVQWTELAARLGDVRPAWVAGAVLILLGEFVLRAARWRVLLRPIGPPARLADLFAAQVIGAAANTLFPLRAGEVAKPLVAARRTGLPFASILATAVLERVFDLFGLLFVLLLMVISLPASAGAEGELVTNLKLYGGLFGLAALVGLGLITAVVARDSVLRAFVFTQLGRLPMAVRRPILRIFDAFILGFQVVRDPAALGKAALLSIWLWVNGAIAIALLFVALGVELPFGAACFTAVAIALTVVLPQAPGFLGVFQVAMEKTMVLWGQDLATAQGFAILFWAVSFLPVTAVGILSMMQEGLTAAALDQAAWPVQAPADALPPRTTSE